MREKQGTCTTKKLKLWAKNLIKTLGQIQYISIQEHLLLIK